MTVRRPRSKWALLALLWLLPGCDGFDPAAFLPAVARSADSSTAPSAGASSPSIADDSGDSARARQPGMESIGPDASMRVYYQFIDDRGRVQFVERLADVPEPWRDRVGYVEMNQPPPLTPAAARKSWQISAGRTAEILLATASTQGGRGDVVLYSATWCGYCRQAQAHLDRENVDYEIRDVDIEAVARELREKTGRGGVPVLDFDGEVLRGYSADHYDRAIRAIKS